MYGYIYKITIEDQDSKLNGCYYIGRHMSDNINDNYYGSGVIIKDYIKAKGIKNLRKEILCECDSEEELNKKEYEEIGDLYKSDSYFINGKCLNMKEGGDHSMANDEAKRKMSVATSGKNNGFYNKKHSDETKERWSLTRRGKNNGMYGKTHSDETKEILRDLRLGTKHTLETIEKYRQIRQGLHWYNNGETDKFCKECPKGFVPGRLSIRKKK